MCVCVCVCARVRVCVCMRVCDQGRIGKDRLLYYHPQIVETMPQSKEVEDFLQSIGPFYEEMEEATQPSVDDARNEPTDSPKQTTAGVTMETFVDESREKKEAESDSEEEIFSDPVGTPESQSVSYLTVVQRYCGIPV